MSAYQEVGARLRPEAGIDAVPGLHTDATTTGHRSGQAHSRYVWYVVGLLSVVNVFNYMDRMALSVLAPMIQADLRLSDSQLGLLAGFAFALFYAVCGIPMALWADRGIRRNIIAISLATWSVMAALCGAAHNFVHLFMARVGLGIGESGCLPPAQSILCDYVPLSRRPGVFAIHNFGLYTGMMVGMALGGWLGQSIGWRWAFVVLGLPGILLALVVRVTLREPARELSKPVKNAGSKPSFRATAEFMWHCRTYRLLLLFNVVAAFFLYGTNQWWPSFCARIYGLDVATIGASLGVAMGVGAGIGLLTGGFVANRAARRDARLPLVIGSVAMALALPAALMSLFASSAFASIAFIALTMLFISVSDGAVIATMYSVLTSRMRALGGAITIFAQSVLGFGLGPFGVGFLSDLLAPTLGTESLRYALLLPIALLPVLIVLLYAASRTSAVDLRAIGARI